MDKVRGEKLALDCNYIGISILLAAKHALTESNFHEEARKIEELIAGMIPF